MTAAACEGLSPKRVIRYALVMTGTELNPSLRLSNRLRDQRAAADCLLYLAQAASERLTLTQAAFFMLAAAADAAGEPATRSALIQLHSEQFRGSIRNTYRQLLEPSRAYPKALGWLAQEPNPEDDRESFLRLTRVGGHVAARALLALGAKDIEGAA